MNTEHITFVTDQARFPQLDDDTVLDLYFTYQPEYVQGIPLSQQETPDDPAELWLDEIFTDDGMLAVSSFTPAQINLMREACWSRVNMLANPDPY